MSTCDFSGFFGERWTLTFSSIEVVSLMPRKCGSSGRHRFPRSTRTASSTFRGRPRACNSERAALALRPENMTSSVKMIVASSGFCTSDVDSTSFEIGFTPMSSRWKEISIVAEWVWRPCDSSSRARSNSLNAMPPLAIAANTSVSVPE